MTVKFVVPAYDRVAVSACKDAVESIPWILRFTPQRRGAIQAGACFGMVPAALASHFDHVYTFEVTPHLWGMCEENLADYKNVTFHRHGLGQSEAAVGVWNPKKANAGSHQVMIGGADSSVRSLDGMDFGREIDLIWLDVEGFEARVLEGAQGLIDQHHPTIVLEMKGQGNYYGITDAQLEEWLRDELGYERRDAWHRDVVYTWKS